MHYVFALYKKDMAEAKAVWILFHLLGIPTVLIAYLAEINVIELGDPYKTIMNICGCLVAIIIVFRAYRKYEKETLENKKTKMEIEQMQKKNK